MRVKLTISYDGSEFFGWQRQTDKRTVQQTIEDALKIVTKKDIVVRGSGRTDAGVHAEGQVADFKIENVNIPAEKYAFALNIVLPPDVKICKSEEVKETFDACRNAKKKTYRYSVYYSLTEMPLKERYKTRIYFMPDIEKMKEGASVIVGEHDFKCFCASGSQVKSTVRRIYSLKILKKGNDIDFVVTGNGFLYNMVRIMVGTLLAVGNEKMQVQDIKNMLESGKRNLAGKTLSPKGLTLVNVKYDK